MTTFSEEWDANRRTFILRLLVEVGSANESVIFKSIQVGGFSRDGRDTIRDDIDHLHACGCLKLEWLNSSLRVASITDRGEDAAYGRIDVNGVERSRWDRKH